MSVKLIVEVDFRYPEKVVDGQRWQMCDGCPLLADCDPYPDSCRIDWDASRVGELNRIVGRGLRGPKCFAAEMKTKETTP